MTKSITKFVAVMAVLFLLLLPAVCSAQKAYVVGDTIYVDDKRKEVSAAEASMHGIVEHIDTAANIATIKFFDKSDYRLRSDERRVASGELYGKRTGTQYFYNKEGRVSNTKEYALLYDEIKGKTRSRLMQETKFYPDGKTPKTMEVYEDGKCIITSYNENGEIIESKEEPESEKEFVNVELMPEFPGGKQGLLRFLSENVNYPEDAKKKGIEGKVLVQFVIDKDGSVTNVEVVRSGGHPSLDKEAVRVISMMPKWKPGFQKGQPVRVRYTVPVNFSFK